MRNNRDAEILALIERLTDDIDLARKHSLEHTIRLLRMAILDLRTLVFSISEAELLAFAELLDDASFPESEAANKC
jgi:hypothetical protein